MLRSIVAVVVTYIVMTVLIIAAFTGLWVGLGPDRLLQPGSFQGNTLIAIAAPSITVIAALFGGWMCARIGRSPKPVMALAVVVLLLGMLAAYFTLQKPYPADPRDPSLTAAQIMEKGREPTWLAIFNPLAGAAAVLIGGLITARRRQA